MKICFVCDGGMGSSALGATLLSRHLNKFELNISVDHASILDMDQDVDIIVCFDTLYAQVSQRCKQAYIIKLFDFSDRGEYERITKRIIRIMKNKKILDINNICLSCASVSSDDAIVAVGKMLEDSGYVEKEYIEGMLARDHSLTTYIGNDLAIPHGEYEVKQFIKKTGLAVRIYPDGIDWNGNWVRIVIGIAAKNDDHMEILSNIASKLCEMEVVEQLVTTQNPSEVFQVLTEE